MSAARNVRHFSVERRSPAVEVDQTIVGMCGSSVASYNPFSSGTVQLTSTAHRMSMAGYAFPHAAGVKLAGSNLCVRRSDIDAYNKDQTIDPWYLMLYDWGKGEGAVRES